MEDDQKEIEMEDDQKEIKMEDDQKIQNRRQPKNKWQILQGLRVAQAAVTERWP